MSSDFTVPQNDPIAMHGRRWLDVNYRCQGQIVRQKPCRPSLRALPLKHPEDEGSLGRTDTDTGPALYKPSQDQVIHLRSATRLRLAPLCLSLSASLSLFNWGKKWGRKEEPLLDFQTLAFLPTSDPRENKKLSRSLHRLRIRPGAMVWICEGAVA